MEEEEAAGEAERGVEAWAETETGVLTGAGDDAAFVAGDGPGTETGIKGDL